jgi:hypothetical protein
MLLSYFIETVCNKENNFDPLLKIHNFSLSLSALSEEIRRVEEISKECGRSLSRPGGAFSVLQMGHCIITWFNGVRH